MVPTADLSKAQIKIFPSTQPSSEDADHSPDLLTLAN